MHRVAVALIALSALLCGCGTSSAIPARQVRSTAPSGIPHLRHVVELILENREYEVSGGPAYLSTLARQGALLSDNHGVTHPSLPNYLALLAGSTFGVHADVASADLPGPTLVTQLEAHHLSWNAYMEDMPGPCWHGAAAGLYAQKHNPFVYFPSIVDNTARCRHVLPMSEMWSNLSHSLPAFLWITPNLCNDGHNCNDATVSSFLAATVPRILRLPSFRSGGALIITYDEGTTNAGCCRVAAGGRIQTIIVGSGIRAGTVIRTPVDHYAVLRAIEAGLRLPYLGYAACRCTPSLSAVWHGGR